MKTRILRPLLAAAIVAALVPGAARAATITPSTFSDDNTDNGNCTLREAVISANTDAADDACTAGTGSDEIRLAAGTYELSVAGPLPEEAAASGDLDILDPDGLKIAGDPAGSTVDANGIDRVFQLLSGANATFDPLTITGGVTGPGDLGGGIAVNGSMATVRNATITGNTATSDGGGFDTSQNSATLNVIDSTVAGNNTQDDGGAFDLDDGTVNITNSTISGNQAADQGGAMDVDGSSPDTFNVLNSTITNNRALAGLGGGIDGPAGAPLNLMGTIVAGNTAGATSPDCRNFNSQGFNLVQNTSGCTIANQQPTDITGQDPQLAPLADNGGPTLTHAIPASSPAVDTGPPDAPATDQRGAPRNPDIGAYELVTCLGAVVNRVGSAGDDSLSGTEGPDAFLLLAGDDTASGVGGDDALCGAEGNDTLSGDAGNDNIEGAAGNDVANGGDGDDLTTGGDGDDIADGGPGNDTADGGAGNDNLKGSDGNDRLLGLDGNDRLNGGNGKDKLKGGNGKDRLNGAKGKDRLNGGKGKDRCNGGASADKGKSCEKEKKIP